MNVEDIGASRPMLDLSIRLAAIDDVAAYCAFMGAIFAENLDTLILDVSPDLKAASRYIALHDGLRSALFLAESDGKLVGTMNFSRFDRPEKDHTVGVGLYVGKENRGQGVGRKLMEAGIAWANGMPDVDRIELLVMANNTPAVRLYESLGFLCEGVKRCSVKKEFGYLDVFMMGLLLKEAASASLSTQDQRAA